MGMRFLFLSKRIFLPSALLQLAQVLRENLSVIPSKRVTAGFDGFIDNIVTIIRKKDDAGAIENFATLPEFGEYILGKSGSSFAFEVEEQVIKAGGNMPIMATSLGTLGVQVNCIGGFGYPEIHSVFRSLPSTCNLFTFCDPGTATAYEFNDGKMILAQMGALHKADWNTIKNRLGLETITGLFDSADLISMVNWSEVDAATGIWKGVSEEVLTGLERKPDRKFFFDLADCSKRSPSTVLEILEVIRSYKAFGKVFLGLNANEARLIYTLYYNINGENHSNVDKQLDELGSGIMEQMSGITIMVHSQHQALSFEDGGKVIADGFFNKHPKISTGAGDNFNAGFSLGLLFNLSMMHSLLLGHAVAGYYVTHGVSPQINELLEFLEDESLNN
jgi:hypothetical protein